jgi:hypothetical protein
LKHFLVFLVISALVAGCGGEDPDHLDTGSAYFPLEKGVFQLYLVHETRYSGVSEPQVMVYELMTEVVDSFPVPGGHSFVISRSRRMATEDPWEVLDTWSARKDSHEVIVSESNTPFVKAIFPVRSGTRWDGNEFNTQGADEYEIVKAGEPFEVDGMRFDDTFTVEQEQNEDLIVFNDERREVYARDVGLIFKEVIQLNYCTDDDCLAQQKIDHGVEMKILIKDYGKH